MEKLSEQKWQYKERYMELKSKSYIQPITISYDSANIHEPNNPQNMPN
jgi:hypothetical protein